MTDRQRMLPALTFIIEWENAIDVVDEWTQRAMRGLAQELAAEQSQMSAKPVLMYLYDNKAVEPGAIDAVIDRVAPELRQLAQVEIIGTEGLSYYQLKNYGAARSQTDLTVMIDSDAIPQPGWLQSILAPFEDPDTQAVGGFTQLGYEDFLSRAMALTWIFNLADEERATERRNSIHVNNCAVRTAFFQSHPFPDLPTFKKQCVFWLRGITQGGHKYVRTAAAKVVHAPHPGLRFLAWRAWTAGLDADFVTYQMRTKGSAGRLVHSFADFAKKLGRAWRRIVLKGKVVGMPLWERPFALLVALLYYKVRLAGHIWASLSRRYDPVPDFRPLCLHAGRSAGEVP